MIPPAFYKIQRTIISLKLKDIEEQAHLQLLSRHSYADLPNIWNGTEKNSLYIRPQYIENIAIRRITYRPPNANSIKLSSF